MHPKCVLSCSVRFVCILAWRYVWMCCAFIAFLGILYPCPRLRAFWHAVLFRCFFFFSQKVRKVHAVLFCAFCVHVGMPFCLDSLACIGQDMLPFLLECCLHMYLACISYAFLGILHACTRHANCVVAIASILQAVSKSLAAFWATTAHAKRMQHACFVLGFCVYLSCAMHTVRCFVLCLLCAF